MQGTARPGLARSAARSGGSGEGDAARQRARGAGGSSSMEQAVRSGHLGPRSDRGGPRTGCSGRAGEVAARGWLRARLAAALATGRVTSGVDKVAGWIWWVSGG